MQDDKKNWNKSALAYDEFIGNLGDPLRRGLIDPIIFEMIGDVKNKKILDAACGNGYITNQLTEKEADAIGLDFSPELILLAKKRFSKSDFLVATLGEKLPFENSSFDKILAHLVLMDVLKLEETINEFSRILKKDGEFVFSILHPCFSPPVSFFKRKILGRINKKFSKMYSKRYFDAGTFLTTIQNSDLSETRIYHRTIAEYMKILKKHNFIITDIREPKADKKFIEQNPNYFQFGKFPVVLIVKGEKTIKN